MHQSALPVTIFQFSKSSNCPVQSCWTETVTMTGRFHCFAVVLTLLHIAVLLRAQKVPSCSKTFLTSYSRGGSSHSSIIPSAKMGFRGSCDLPRRFRGGTSRYRCSRCERYCNCVKIFANLHHGGSRYNAEDRKRCCKDNKNFKLYALSGCGCASSRVRLDDGFAECHCQIAPFSECNCLFP